MKKLFLGMLAIVGMIATSCVQEQDLVANAAGEAVAVSFNVGTPAMRANFSDGATATHLQYAVYDANGNILSDLTVLDGDITGGSTTVTLQLVTGNNYSVLFWAAAPNAPYTVSFGNNLSEATMTVDYTAPVCSDENRDAFYTLLPIEVKGAMTVGADLKRPFAQLNIGTNDYDEATSAGYTVSHAKVATSAYTTLNFADGSVSTLVPVEFAYAAVPTAETFPVATYEYMAMNYLLMAKDPETVDVTFYYATDAQGANEKSRTVGSVPVQRNHRTNLYGALLTSLVTVNVEIKPAYDEPANDVELPAIIALQPITYVEDGVEKTLEGIGYLGTETNAAGEEVPVFGITNGDGLSNINLLMSGVNARNNALYTIEGATVKLLADIDLDKGLDENGERISVAPVGRSDRNVKNPFKGTFDGNGHTIKNLYQNGWDFGYELGSWGSLGLFGKLQDATVKNLTIEGFELRVEGGNCGGIAGNAAGNCVFENITVKNSVFCSYNNGVAGILGWPEAGNYLFKDIKIESDVTIAAFWGTYDASLAGVLAEAYTDGTYHFENIEVSCKLDAYNDVISNYKWYLYRHCGMIVGNVDTVKSVDGRTYADPAGCNITCSNVVVNYGDWMNYHYCVPNGNNQGNYRVEPGYSYGGLPANHDHTTCANGECCNELLPFDQLFGGRGNDKGINGVKEYEGVTVNYPASYVRE